MNKNSQTGFINFLILIPLVFLATTAAVGAIKLHQIDSQIKQNERQIETELADLNQINQSFRKFQEKLIISQGKGVDTVDLDDKNLEISHLIRQKKLSEAREKIASFDATLDELLLQKREVDRKVTVELRDKLETKLESYKKQGVDVTPAEGQITEIRALVDSEEFDSAREKITEVDKLLDKQLAKKQEADRKAEEARLAQEAAKRAAQGRSAQINSASSYSRKTISTSRGSFTVDVVTINLSSARVVTDSANSDDCGDSCPVKPLASYISDNGGFAGMNGTYFCPSDYGSCAGKVNSFDFPVYNSRLSKFINASKLFWGGRAMIAFDDASNPYFFREANSFGGVAVSAAIVNYPALVSGGQIVVNEGALSSNLKAKGTRGAMGFSGKTLYLVIGRGASVGDMAYVMQALGAQNAMNMDGGGSSALYYGGYKVGPGRNLPNAVIIK